MTEDRLMPPCEAAQYMALQEQTLAVWRIRGEGPPFLKLGRSIRYRLSDLEAYLHGRRCQNTAQAEALTS